MQMLSQFAFLFQLSLILAPQICWAQIGQLLQFSDFHVNLRYDQRGDPDDGCLMGAVPSTKLLGQFGHRNCDPPPFFHALIDYMLAEAKRHVPNPDFIAWTGDSASHDYHDEQRLLETIGFASDAIRRHFGAVPVIPVLGNHDHSPSNVFPELERTELYERIYGLWKDWVGPEGKETFLRGGYFRRRIGNFTFLSLNTNVYYTWNWAAPNFTHPDDPNAQFAFLQKELESAKREQTIVHIFGHIPPGGIEHYKEPNHWQPQRPMPMPQKFNKRLIELFVEYAPWIGFILFGHIHMDTFRIVKNSNGNAVQRIFFGPSVTPIFGLNNPAFKLFEYNRKSAQIEDIKAYYVDLDELNRKGAEQIRVKFEYSMRSAYGLDNFDAKSLHLLVQKFKTNDKLFVEFARYRKAMLHPGTPNATERTANLCILEEVDLDALENCLNHSDAGQNFDVGHLWCCVLILLPLCGLLARRTKCKQSTEKYEKVATQI